MINYVIRLCGIRWPQCRDQLFLVVKITTLILIIGCLHVSAASLSQTIHIRADRWSLNQVFDAIRNQTDYRVIYNDALVDPSASIILVEDKISLDALLTRVLSPLSLTYRIKEKTILIGRTVNLEQRPLTGKVMDDKGEACSGVNVRVKGTDIGAVTDSKGFYRIYIPDEKAIEVFSY